MWDSITVRYKLRRISENSILGNLANSDYLNHTYIEGRWDRAEDRRVFVTRALEKGVVSKAVECCERGSVGLAVAALNFLADFTFQSDAGAEAVLDQFPRINARCL